MATTRGLHDYFVGSASRFPDRTAIVEPGQGAISYGDLADLSTRLRGRLHAIGVRPGDRVGIYLRKSIDAVAAMYGILRCGAAYVPVDPGAPASRDAYILHDCAVKALVIEERFVAGFREETAAFGWSPAMLVLPGTGGGAGLRASLDEAGAGGPPAPVSDAPVSDAPVSDAPVSDAPVSDAPVPDAPVSDAPVGGTDLAYILYTSGSTGKPKGVMLSHDNAVSFVDWCSEVFEPRADDRFSSHAPFHFDLSILDVHVSLKHGATLVLVPEERGKDPQHLAQLIADERISIWYSAPSILSLLGQFGNLPRCDTSALRMVLFAGEVFPVKHLRTVTELLPRPRYFNLYGPTETNVCTWYEVELPVPAERTAPYPIGKVCSHLRGKVVDEAGNEVARGEEGELCIAGRGVMQGYWALREQTARGFLVDGEGLRWYRTGDIVVEAPDGNFTYRGRRDRMVKRRGYRVELGEIEVGLYQHPQVKEVAVIAAADEEAGVRITAFVSCREGRQPSLIEIKRFCADRLPLYMIPDRFSWHPALPKTSTDKIDYQRLKEML